MGTPPILVLSYKFLGVRGPPTLPYSPCRWSQVQKPFIEIYCLGFIEIRNHAIDEFLVDLVTAEPKLGNKPDMIRIGGA